MKNLDIPFGYEKDGKLYLSAWGDHPDREIGEVREGDIEKSVTFFVERFTDLQKKIDEVVNKIAATDNKGSFLMKLLHLKEQLSKHDGLGDYHSLYKTLDRNENQVTDIIKKNRERNSEIKKALIEEAKQIVEIINWKEGTEKVNDIKSRWIKTGNAEEEKKEKLDEEFWGLIKGFFDRKKSFYEDKQKLVEFRTQQYHELVAEAEKTTTLYGKVRFDRIKELREQWKNVGGVPKEVFSPLIEQFNNHLKEKDRGPQMDYSQFKQVLNEIKKGDAPFDKKKLDDIKQKVYRQKARNPEKGEILELINLLTEREFIIKLSKKRFPDFEKLEASKKKSIRTGIVRDLINRDKEEFKIYEENSSNFSSSDGKMNKIVESKLKGQKRKIIVKEKLLEWIENDEF